MSLLDQLSGMDLQDILGQMGPSLLTSPQMGDPQPDMPQTLSAPTAPPTPDISKLLTPEGQSYPRMGPATPEQLTAQKAPLNAHILGGSFMQKLLDGLVPIPDAYRALLSPKDIQRIQLQGIAHIGAGLTGAYTPAGVRKDFGPDLAYGFGAAHQGVGESLKPMAESVGLDNVIQQMQARQTIGSMYPKISDDPDEAQKQYLNMAHHAAMAGLPEAAQYVAMANSIRDRSSGAGSDRVAPPEWSAAYDKAHPEPPTHTQDHVDWAYDKARQAVNDGYTTSASQYRTMGDAERLAGQFKVSSGQRQEALGQGAMRIADAQTKAFEARPDVKPIMAQVPAINMTQAVLDEAKKGNKAAYESVIGNFAQTVDQKAQLRTQMFDIMSRLDPSVQGRFRIAWTRLMDGTWSPEDLQGVESVLKSVKAAKVRDYTTAYADYQKSHKTAHLVSPDVLFSTSPATSGLVGTPKY